MNQWAGGGKEERLDEPPIVYMRCSEHGVERFFLADMMCTKCERENLGIINEDDFVALGRDGASGSDGEKEAEQARPRTSSVRRKSSFAFH